MFLEKKQAKKIKHYNEIARPGNENSQSSPVMGYSAAKQNPGIDSRLNNVKHSENKSQQYDHFE